MVLYRHPTTVLCTHLGRCCHTDFWDKVVLKETDDVLLLQFLCRGDFRQRWYRRPLPCLQSIKHKQSLIQPKMMCKTCKNLTWTEVEGQIDYWLKFRSAYRNRPTWNAICLGGSVSIDSTGPIRKTQGSEVPFATTQELRSGMQGQVSVTLTLN